MAPFHLESEDGVCFPRAGPDGFLCSATFGWPALVEAVLPCVFKGVLPRGSFPGLGLRLRGRNDVPGAGSLVAEAIELRFGVALACGVFATPNADVRRGVPPIVERLLLNGVFELRPYSYCPVLEPGRLPCLECARPEPSEL